jgi:hypothetical protein
MKDHKPNHPAGLNHFLLKLSLPYHSKTIGKLAHAIKATGQNHFFFLHALACDMECSPIGQPKTGSVGAR